MIRHALRTIRRMPGLAAVVILSLGVGIGVNTAVFSWIQALVLKPIPGVDDSAQLLSPSSRRPTPAPIPACRGRSIAISRRGCRLSKSWSAFRMAPLNVGESGRTERTYALLVSGNYFRALGLQPAAGRFIRPDEVDVSRRASRSSCCRTTTGRRVSAAARPRVGQTLRVNDHALTIVGVAPEGFQGTVMGLQFDLWVPATLAPALVPGSTRARVADQRGYSAMGRLRAGATEAAGARRNSSTAMSELATTFPETNGRISGELLPFWKAARGPQMMFITALAILQGVMLLVLLAVCGNTANLVLARASTRSSRSRRSPRARRRTRQRDPADAGREPAARRARRRRSAC